MSSLWGYGAEGPRLQVSRSGELYRIDASFVVGAPAAAVWRCLTSYGKLAEILPSVEESRVLGREGDSAIRLFQRLRLQVLPFFPVSVYFELRVREQPPAVIEFEDVRQAYFTLYRGRWEVAPSREGGARVRYVLEFSPRPLLKPLLQRMPETFTERFLTEFQTALQRGCVP